VVTESGREALIRAGERLFGERGIGAVSLREVAAEAGQGNNSAVRYHFGSRQGLVDAIFTYRMELIDQRRRAMLADAGADPDLRTLVQALVFPLAESIGHEDGVSWYARFIRQVVFDPGFDVFAPPRDEVTRGLRTVIDGLSAHASHLPPTIRARRILQVAEIVVHALADQEAQLAHGRAGVSTALLASDLMDCSVAVLGAPVSCDTARELELFSRKQA
jgi:AcrR family transcriptional regulator